MSDGNTVESQEGLFDVSEKDIYKFSKEFPSNQEQGIPDHYHICVKVADLYMIFNCCTSQSGKVKDRMEFFGRIYVEVKNKRQTRFTEPTFVDCDNVFSISNEDFNQYIVDGKVEFAGRISGGDYQNIVNGILQSDLVEESTKKLFL